MTVQRVDVGLREPVQHRVEALDHLVVVQHITRDRRELRPDLLAAHLVAPAVQRIQHRLGQVDAGAEELHLLADAHCRDAARNGAVIARFRPHQIVGLVLDRAGIDRRLDREALEALGQPRRPEHGDVGLGRWSEVVQGVQHPECALGDERAAVLAHSTHHLGYPNRIAGEQFVVLRRAQEAHDAPLDDEIVDDFLGLRLRQRPFAKVPLEIDVPERGQASRGHCRAILLLDGGEIAEVGPLHRLARVARRAGDVVAIEQCHLLQLLQRPDLLGQLLAQPDHVLGRMAIVQLLLLALLVGDEEVDAVERHSPIVADDAAAAVGVRQAGHDARCARRPDGRRVGVEYAVVVRLAVLGKDFAKALVRLVAVGFETRRDHAPTAKRHDRALERRVGLQADDDLVILVDVAGPVRENAGRDLRYIEDPFLAFLGKQGLQRFPHAAGALGRALQEGAVALVGGVVALDEFAHVDAALPTAGREAAPCDVPSIVCGFRNACHDASLR